MSEREAKIIALQILKKAQLRAEIEAAKSTDEYIDGLKAEIIDLRKQLESFQEDGEEWECVSHLGKKSWVRPNRSEGKLCGRSAENYPTGTRLIVTAQVDGGEQ